MAKILLINGSPRQNGCTDRALREIAETLEAGGVQAEVVWLGNQPMQDCIACGSCRKTGKCVFDKDPVNEIAAKMDFVDGIVIGSPVYYSGATGRLTSFLDRLFFSTPKEKFAGKIGAAVASARRAGTTATFQRLNQYFLIQNMIVVGSQYWNEVHGATPADVEQDEEGLQTMRTLARNMIWLLGSIEAGKKQGLTFPPDELPRKKTNFI